MTSGSMRDLPLHPADENGDRGVVDDVITDAPQHGPPNLAQATCPRHDQGGVLLPRDLNDGLPGLTPTGAELPIDLQKDMTSYIIHNESVV